MLTRRPGETPARVVTAALLDSGVLSPEDVNDQERFLTFPQKKGLSGGISSESWVCK